MSDLLRWFEKRKETKALGIVQRHLALTIGIVEDLDKAIHAAVDGDAQEMRRCIERVASSEKEADVLRRKVMDEISRGELSPSDRDDLMGLVKGVDMVADWNRESTRILGAIPMEDVPETIKAKFSDMIRKVKACVISLRKCVNKMMTKSEEALQAADEVEREEEKVDDINEEARILLGKEDIPRAGVAVLTGQLFEAMEMIADSCEDVCDQVRVIMVRR